MEKKRLTSLTESDLLDRPVWEHWTEDNIEYVRPSDKVEIGGTSNVDHIVLTDFSLNNGANLTGFCSPQDPSGLDYIQPVVCTHNGQVELWRDCGWTTKDKEKELQKLGLDWKDVFPINYRTLVKSDGEFYQATLTDFNEEKIKTVPNKS